MTYKFSFLMAAALCTLAACGDSRDDDRSYDRSDDVPCKGPSTDKDCVGDTPAKFDCSSSDEQADAKSAGCVAEDPTDDNDYDVCCPKDTRSSHGTTKVSCLGPTTDSDCTGAYPGKFDCKSDSASSDAKSKGCISEHPEDSTELDVCCPAGVGQD